MKPSEILRAAKRLIDTEDKWWFAGMPNAVSSSNVGKKCMLDAVRCAGATDFSAAGYLHGAIGEQGIMMWNDAPERTHADVMAAFDRAIALAEKDELPQKVRESDDAYCKRVLSEIIAAPVAEQNLVHSAVGANKLTA